LNATDGIAFDATWKFHFESEDRINARISRQCVLQRAECLPPIEALKLEDADDQIGFEIVKRAPLKR
jgi:hypothetical protein